MQPTTEKPERAGQLDGSGRATCGLCFVREHLSDPAWLDQLGIRQFQAELKRRGWQVTARHGYAHRRCVKKSGRAERPGGPPARPPARGAGMTPRRPCRECGTTEGWTEGDSGTLCASCGMIKRLEERCRLLEARVKELEDGDLRARIIDLETVSASILVRYHRDLLREALT